MRTCTARATRLCFQLCGFVLEQEAFPERIAPDVAVIWEVKAQTLPCVGITRIRKTYDMHTIRSAESASDSSRQAWFCQNMVFSTDAVEPAAHKKAKARTTLNLIFRSRVLMVS